jgi:hypothetical protein
MFESTLHSKSRQVRPQGVTAQDQQLNVEFEYLREFEPIRRVHLSSCNPLMKKSEEKIWWHGLFNY